MSRAISKAESTLLRFHPILYISVVCISLAVAILLYYSIYNISTTSSTDRKAIDTTFNEDTIDRIEKLNTPEDESRNTTLPDGRINPFM